MTPELEELKKLAERLRQIVKKYEAKNPLRAADFHGEDCACYRCAVDACDAAVNALQGLVERVEKAEASDYASASAAAQNVIDGLMAENAKLKAALEPDMFWDQDNPEQPYYDIEELFREQDYDRDRDIIIDTQEAIRCEDGAYFCRINSPSEDSETDDEEVIIRKLTDDERKQWRAVYRVWLSMQYLKPLFARAALRSEP